MIPLGRFPLGTLLLATALALWCVARSGSTAVVGLAFGSVVVVVVARMWTAKLVALGVAGLGAAFTLSFGGSPSHEVIIGVPFGLGLWVLAEAAYSPKLRKRLRLKGLVGPLHELPRRLASVASGAAIGLLVATLSPSGTSSLWLGAIGAAAIIGFAVCAWLLARWAVGGRSTRARPGSGVSAN